jgi:hypothetical protein
MNRYESAKRMECEFASSKSEKLPKHMMWRHAAQTKVIKLTRSGY